MHRPSNNLLNYRQPPSNVDNYKTLSESVTKPPNARISRQSPTIQNDEWDYNRKLNELAMKSPNARISHQSPRTQNDEWDHNRKLNELAMKSPNARISRQPPTIQNDEWDNNRKLNELAMKSPNARISHQAPRVQNDEWDHNRKLNELAMKSPNTIISRQSPRIQNDEWDNNRTLNELVMKTPNARTSRHSPTIQNDEWDNNRTIRKLITDQPLNPSRSRSSSTVSLKSMVIEGQWKYRGHDEDHLRLKSIGIENLVSICHDIMSKTYESINRKREKRRKSPSINDLFPIVKLDEYKKITTTERTSLQRARLFNLMTIVYEAASTSASISQLVRIWREASEHNLHHHRRKKAESVPLISYETAFQHLIRTPDNQLLQIGLHASLLSNRRLNLRRLGDKLGIQRNQFDMDSIRDSTKAFQILIQILREQKLRHKQEQKHIDRHKLPYKPKQKQGLYANVSGTKFRLIRQAVDISGFDICPDADFTCNLLWNDTLISMDIVSALKPYQKVNHFPTMNEISRKDLLAKNYDRLSNLVPKEYNFAPKSWILPNDYNLWYSCSSNKPKKDPLAYILKPTNDSMGQGIAIHCDNKQIRPMDNYIIQEYIREPYLIDGFKFDLRIYALITSCDPLRVFIFNNGLVRICSKKYEIPNPKNALDLSMHLTNYLIDDDDDFDIDNGKKRSLKFLLKYLKEQKQDEVKLWKEIENIVLKTIFLAEPHLLTAYRTCRPGILPTSESVCFELLGFDILIDKNLKPWIIEVNRCPSFDTDVQIEFDIKIKLLFDTFELLRFRISDRQKSIAIEKIEAQHRLYANLGRHKNDRTHELDELKENLYLLRREKTREIFENHHLGGYIRLFPINNDKEMNELMDLLTKCFQVLSTNKNNSLWNMKYFHRFNEEELLYKITHLEDINQTDRQESSRLTHASDRARASTPIGFTFESSDDENRSPSRSPHSDRMKKSPLKTTDPFMKRVSTQTPFDILRSTSSSSLNMSKKKSNTLISTGNVTRPRAESQKTQPGVSANRITEKKAYITPSSSSENLDRQRPHSSKPRKSNDKSQIVTYSSIIQATRQQQLIDQSTTIDMTKELQLNNNDINRLHQLILEEMNKLCIHYPNKSDKETYQICTEIIENWDRYKPDIARFWFAELDTDKRQSVVEIVWNNVQQVMKKICLVDELVQQLPLNRQLMKLKRRLLANHGQPLWDACQDKHNSWKSLFVKSTNNLSTIELDCCYLFVDLCKEALFIVYQYSVDEKIQKQKQIHQRLTIMVN